MSDKDTAEIKRLKRLITWHTSEKHVRLMIDNAYQYGIGDGMRIAKDIVEKRDKK